MSKSEDLVNKSDLKENFAILPNDVIQNFDLSLDARGLLIYILSLPKDWVININHLSKTNKIGRDKCYKLIKQLIEHKYIIRTEVRSSGRIKEYTYKAFPKPQKDSVSPLTEKPYTEKSYTEKPYTENQHIYKEHTIQRTNNKKETYTDAFEEFWKVCKRKQGKDRTYKKYQEIIKTVDSAILIKKMKQYNEEKEECKTEIQYYKNPYTWLHQKGWEDEYLITEETQPSDKDIMQSWLHKYKKLGYQLEEQQIQQLKKHGLL